jgi:flagellar hook-associated protein 1
MIDIKWTEGQDSTVTIQSGGNAILVAGNDASRLEAVPTPATEGKIDGDYDIVYHHHEYAEPLVITDRIEGGRLGGTLKVRDKDVREFQGKIDTLAYEIANQVNQLHAEGYNSYNQKGAQFFDPLASRDGAANNIKVSALVLGDVGHIAAGIDPNSPGDNRVANMIGELQYKKDLINGSSSMDEYYNGIVSEMGLRTEKANHLLETQEGVVKQLENLRESYSGVNVDEEVANMIEWQKQFDASARIIRTADEMLDTVLNLRKY